MVAGVQLPGIVKPWNRLAFLSLADCGGRRGMTEKSNVRNTSRLLACAILGAAAVALAACGQSGSLGRSSLTTQSPASDAIVLPGPGGPEVVSVIERRYANAVQQDVLLATAAATAGENRLRVQLFGPTDPTAQTRLANPRLAEAEIAGEMRTLFPGISMRRSPFFVQNDYGPFGYAVGRNGRDLCVYAWQRIDAPAHASRFFDNRGSVQLRLRLCETGATEESLLSVMYGYSINAFSTDRTWNPFGGPPPPDDGIGRTGSPVYPRGSLRTETVLEPVSPPAARPASPRPAPAPVRAETVAAPLPAPVGPRVPPPPAAARSPELPRVPPPPPSGR
jgi:hypothetical protein